MSKYSILLYLGMIRVCLLFMVELGLFLLFLMLFWIMRLLFNIS